MSKLIGTQPNKINTLKEAAAWLSTETGKPTDASGVIDAGARSQLRVQVAIPKDFLRIPLPASLASLPASDVTPQIVRNALRDDADNRPTPFNSLFGTGRGDGISDWRKTGLLYLSWHDCRELQAHPSIQVFSAKPEYGEEVQFSKAVAVTAAMLRVTGTDLKVYAAKLDAAPVKEIPISGETRAPQIVGAGGTIKCQDQGQGIAPPAADATDAADEISPTGDNEELAALFDPVKFAQLETMFPCNGKWKSYAERAARNGLKTAAKEGRGLFNPYRAALWWLTTGPSSWSWEKCLRKLANNLPDRSRDSKHLLTGEFD